MLVSSYLIIIWITKFCYFIVLNYYQQKKLLRYDHGKLLRYNHGKQNNNVNLIHRYNMMEIFGKSNYYVLLIKKYIHKTLLPNESIYQIFFFTTQFLELKLGKLYWRLRKNLAQMNELPNCFS